MTLIDEGSRRRDFDSWPVDHQLAESEPRKKGEKVRYECLLKTKKQA